MADRELSRSSSSADLLDLLSRALACLAKSSGDFDELVPQALLRLTNSRQAWKRSRLVSGWILQAAKASALTLSREATKPVSPLKARMTSPLFFEWTVSSASTYALGSCARVSDAFP